MHRAGDVELDVHVHGILHAADGGERTGSAGELLGEPGDDIAEWDVHIGVQPELHAERGDDHMQWAGDVGECVHVHSVMHAADGDERAGGTGDVFGEPGVGAERSELQHGVQHELPGE